MSSENKQDTQNISTTTKNSQNEQPSTINSWSSAELRENCWKSWADYFYCSEGMDPLIAIKQCKTERKNFTGSCPKSWVQHFLEVRAANPKYKPPKYSR